VIFETSVNDDGSNTTLSITMRDQNREPVPSAMVTVGTPFSSKTYLTDGNGSLKADLENAAPGQIVDIEFSGDPSRYLIPAAVNITIPPGNTTSSDDLGRWVIPVLIVAGIVSICVVGLLVLRRRRIDKGSKRVEEARTGTLYPFKPRKGAQEMIYNSYKDVLSYLGEKGIGRPPEMTPDEFEEAVRTSIRNGDMKELHEITKLFDEARYSDHDLSSHLISKAKTLENELEKEIALLEEEGLREKFQKARESMVSPVQRPILWKMKMDHAGDLKALIGDKEGGK
jgi:hypothetical protein